MYGEPLEIQGKTIIPVSRAKYGLGSLSPRPDGKQAHPPENRTQQTVDDLLNNPKAGAGVSVTPVGVLEITKDDTRFVPVPDTSLKIAGALLAGLAFGLGMVALRRRNRSLTD